MTVTRKAQGGLSFRVAMRPTEPRRAHPIVTLVLALAAWVPVLVAIHFIARSLS